VLPFAPWTIDFSEITVGARVGVGKGPEALNPTLFLRQTPLTNCWVLPLAVWPVPLDTVLDPPVVRVPGFP